MTSPLLLMLSGSAWGAGKSTLADALFRSLRGQARPARLLTEDHLLATESFARFERLLGPTNPETHRADLALLDAARTLVDDALSATGGPDAPSVVIVDALLPGLFWLFGRYDTPHVASFARTLARTLSPLRPLLLYLHADPAVLLRRAATERGEDWLARLPAIVSRWNVPHYPGPPVRTLEDVAHFWSWLDAETVAFLPSSPFDFLILDALQPPTTLRDAVLAHPRLATP
jgi:hypothetical protein